MTIASSLLSIGELKALIGLSQLNAIEIMARSESVSRMKSEKAIYTYYIAYHLFYSLMLTLPHNIVGRLEAPKSDVEGSNLNNPSEEPGVWNACKNYEADWATLIGHGQVKKFCKEWRKASWDCENNGLYYMKSLYKYFVDPVGSETKCIPGLYEKLCYVRDRVIYRPSYVVSKTGERFQTSAQLGKEIDSLPTSVELFATIREVYDGLIRSMLYEKVKLGKNGNCTIMLSAMWNDEAYEKDIDAICELGHSKRRLIRLGHKDDSGFYSFPSYISQLIEIESIDFIRYYSKKYWNPLEKKYNYAMEQYRSQKVNI